MARAKKKSSRKPETRKVNKTAWIREQPADMAAKDVVAKAKVEGITLSPAQVYTARNTAKKAGLAGAKGLKGQASAGGRNDEMAFRRLVLSIGLPTAESYLADLKRSVGL